MRTCIVLCRLWLVELAIAAVSDTIQSSAAPVRRVQHHLASLHTTATTIGITAAAVLAMPVMPNADDRYSSREGYLHRAVFSIRICYQPCDVANTLCKQHARLLRLQRMQASSRKAV
jgi:hypothetical protein